MSRRVTLPGADELFRPTKGGDQSLPEAPPGDGDAGDAFSATGPLVQPVPSVPLTSAPSTPEPGDAADSRRSSGRVRHDEKVTVYVTADELFDLEAARLSLRRGLGVAVDRGRLVREAVAICLADLDERGGDSELARRLGAT